MKTIRLKTAVICSVLISALFILYGLLSESTYFHDDIMHFLISKFSWRHPELLLDTWGRPAFTILYSPVSQFGFSSARIFSAILAGVTSLLGGYLAYLYGVRWYWLGVILIGFQIEFFKQGFSLLTELTFAFLFCLVLIFHKKGNWLFMAICLALLPLARYESLPVVILFIAILMQQRQYAYIFIVPIPLLIQNGITAIMTQQVSALIFPLDKLLGINPGGYNEFQYDPSSPFFFLLIAPIAFNFIIFFFCCIGSFSQRFGVLQISMILTIGVLNLTNWLFPGAAVAEYPRFLAQIAPAVGILAAIGIEKLLESQHHRREWYLILLLFMIFIPWIWLMNQQSFPLLLLLPLVVAINLLPIPYRKVISTISISALVVILTMVNVHPFPPSQENDLVGSAAGWLKNSAYSSQKMYGSHVYFSYVLGIDIFDSTKFEKLTPSLLAQAEKGNIVIWDSHYSDRLNYQVPLELLENNPKYTLLESWRDGRYRLKIFIVNS